jgi:hypothetical protein
VRSQGGPCGSGRTSRRRSPVSKRLPQIVFTMPCSLRRPRRFFPGPKSEGRKRIARCARTGNRMQDALAPERGVRIRAGCIFRPVPGLVNHRRYPRLCAVG